MLSSWSRGRIAIVAGVLAAVVVILYAFVGASAASWHPVVALQHGISADNLDNVGNGTLGFEKIFAISLASRTDQRDGLALASALTGLHIDLVDGVTDVDPKTLPPGGSDGGLLKGTIGAWRAHMNTLRMIVDQNITSALIMEGDVDWDLRIKSQMRDLARAARVLVQPITGTTDQFLDPTFPTPKPGQTHQDFDLANERVPASTTSPYGDVSRWDLLWLGHCGAEFPAADSEYSTTPLGRAVMFDDETVPESQHIHIEWGKDDLVRQYPGHTRVVSRARMNVCSLAYGVTQQGARRILNELGLRKMEAGYDIMLRHFCDGEEGRLSHICLSVQPQLFQHHRTVGPKSANSDIMGHGDGYNDHAFSLNIRWSTRLNIQNLLDGATDYIDLFRDGEQDSEHDFK